MSTYEIVYAIVFVIIALNVIALGFVVAINLGWMDNWIAKREANKRHKKHFT